MINGNELALINSPAFGVKAGDIGSARTFDADTLRLFYFNPKIWEPMQCDGGVDVEDLDFDELVALSEFTDTQVFVTSSTKGVLAGLFMFSMETPQCYSIHSALLPEFWGKGIAPLLGLSACIWMFNNTECLKITTLVPEFNKSAFVMAVRAGMMIEGVNRSSFMKNGILYDQTMLGFTKEETLCQ